MRIVKSGIIFLAAIAIAAGFTLKAWAVPTLQLYVPDAGVYYDDASESWVYPGLEYDLWAVGATNKENVTIYDVMLAAAVKTSGPGNIALQPIDGNGNPLDDLMTPRPIAYGTPIMGDGSSLPGHDIFPSWYYIFDLGDFILTDTNIPDFGPDYLTNPEATRNYGLIRMFHVTVTGGFEWVHWDLFDHIKADNSVFAPFSHDADVTDGPTPVPEPATMLLLGSGLFGLASLGRRELLARKSTLS